MKAETFPADGRTDRHDEANSRVSQFWERARNVYFNSVSGKVCVSLMKQAVERRPVTFKVRLQFHTH